jgi:hypothetical protein
MMVKEREIFIKVLFRSLRGTGAWSKQSVLVTF